MSLHLTASTQTPFEDLTLLRSLMSTVLLGSCRLLLEEMQGGLPVGPPRLMPSLSSLPVQLAQTPSMPPQQPPREPIRKGCEPLPHHYQLQWSLGHQIVRVLQ